MIGLEPTFEEHLQNMVDVFSQVRRVLREDGTCWLNYGDAYAGSGRGSGDTSIGTVQRGNKGAHNLKHYIAGSSPGKPKDLILMPFRIAMALQQPVHTGPIKKDVDRAWLAGLVDGDGTIGIRISKPRKEFPTQKNPTFVPYLAVSLTDTVALERCKEITGLGNINLKGRGGKAGSRGIHIRKDFFSWRLDGQVASKVIRDIYPYLVIKQNQAKIVYALNRSLANTVPFTSVPEKVVKYRTELYELNKLCNQRKDFDMPNLPSVKPNEEPMFYVRSHIVISKKNPMPESVKDRPTCAHEELFLLTKSPKYYYDWMAVSTQTKQQSIDRLEREIGGRRAHPKENEGRRKRSKQSGHGPKHDGFNERYQATEVANLRNVWTMGTPNYSAEHFATFGEELPEICIKAGTSEEGVCSTCGAPTERKANIEYEDTGSGIASKEMLDQRKEVRTWEKGKRKLVTDHEFVRTCEHDSALVPALVFDPFGGAGTTSLVATKLRRDSVMTEISPEYADMARQRIESELSLMCDVTMDTK